MSDLHLVLAFNIITLLAIVVLVATISGAGETFMMNRRKRKLYENVFGTAICLAFIAGIWLSSLLIIGGASIAIVGYFMVFGF